MSKAEKERLKQEEAERKAQEEGYCCVFYYFELYFFVLILEKAEFVTCWHLFFFWVSDSECTERYRKKEWIEKKKINKHFA